MLDGRWRAGVERGLAPVGDRLRRVGLSADVLTALGLACSLGTAVLIATGHLGWAVVGVICSGLGDLLDGAVARRSGQTSPRGAFFDSVADRVSDAALLGGVAWYLAGESAYLPVLAFAVAALSMVISYERAKAESLGLVAKGGLMERAERFIFLGVALAFDILVPVLWVMLVLTSVTAIDRFWRVYQQAARPPARTHRAERTRRREGAGDRPDDEGARLRHWWESRRPGERPRLRHWWESRRPGERPHGRHRSERRSRP